MRVIQTEVSEFWSEMAQEIGRIRSVVRVGAEQLW